MSTKFKNLPKDQQRQILDSILHKYVEDFLNKGKQYKSLSSSQQDDIERLKQQSNSFCGCYPCIQNLMNTIKSSHSNIAEYLISQIMKQAENE